MKLAINVVVVLLGTCVPAWASDRAEPPQPNIVLILADDAGLGHITAYPDFATEFAQTPFIDALAESGIRFTRAYTPGSMCWPTRGSLLTGRWPMIWNNSTEVPRSIPRIGQMLQHAGYFTMMVGKTHNGIEQGNIPPTGWGYDRYVTTYTSHDYFSTYTGPGLGEKTFTNFLGPESSFNNQGSSTDPIEYDPETLAIPNRRGVLTRAGYSNMDDWRRDIRYPIRTVPHEWAMRYAPVLESDPTSETGHRFVTDFGSYTVDNRITDGEVKAGYLPEYYNQAAVRFIREHVAAKPDQPFFLYMPHSSPHVPSHDPPAELLAPERRTLMGQYGPQKRSLMMDIVDKGVGDILATLQALGIRDNTMVVFCSDNGGDDHTTGHLRGRKGQFFEGGIRTPLIISWPAGLKRVGTDCDATVTLMDLAPTFLAMAGAPASADLDGVNLLPCLRGGQRTIQRDPDALFWATRNGSFVVRHDEYDEDGTPLQLYKLVGSDGETALYDLLTDPSEERPLDAPAVRDRLQKLYDRWLTELPDPK